ncbi:MAG TPA: hypothetical protein PLM79_08010 [Syntrophobacteraceae bacterium]|nr:hypothetical protein [Syntrophobacteraceae bacterium]
MNPIEELRQEHEGLRLSLEILFPDGSKAGKERSWGKRRKIRGV